MTSLSVVRSFRAVLVGLATLSGAGTSLVAQAAPHYPSTPRGAQSDDLNGIRVPDPYRWLENVGSADVRAWIAAQNSVTEGYLGQLPRRGEVGERVAASWIFPKVSAPIPGGDRLFFFENGGSENQPALYVQDHAAGLPRVLVDPNAFAQDGLIAIVDQSPSPDGRYVAYAVSTQGSPWRSIRVRDVRAGQDLSDELVGIKDEPIAWTKDVRGFFYIRSDLGRPTANPLAPDGRQRMFYHRLGKAQSDDRLMYENPDHPEWRLRADVSTDGQYLVITLRTGTELHNRLYFIDLDNPKRPNLDAPLVKLVDAGDALYEFVANQGPIFFLRTSKDAPRNRLVAADINISDPNRWTTVVRETNDPLIEVRRVDDRIVAHRLMDAHSVLELYSLDGGVRGTVQLPGVGTVTELNPDPEAREFYFTFTSFLQPQTAYRYDLDSRNVAPFKEPHADDLTTRFETTQLFFTSKDGTRVPMFITARRGVTLDGTHATLLRGEGSLNVAATPVFSREMAAWLELGGIYAVANVRGGGEYGRFWHDAASGAKKQVAIDDFISAAEFLISQRYTRAPSLGAVGRGVGGLLVGAAMTQRPELFGAVSVDAGLFDMARFSRFTIGATWIPEFGSPDRQADLKTLLAYSPLQNVRTGTRYPPTLISTGDQDGIVVAAHSYKFAASLQAAQAGSNPILLRVDHDVSDGPGVPTAKRIAASTDRLTFLVNALNVQPR